MVAALVLGSAPLLVTPADAVVVDERLYLVDDVDADSRAGLSWLEAPGLLSGNQVVQDDVYGQVDVRDLSASGDGTRVIYVQDSYRVDGAPLRQRVVVRDVSTRVVRVVEDLPLGGTTQLSSPALSPNGLTALWTQTTGSSSVVRKASVASGGATTLVSGYRAAVFLDATTLFVQQASMPHAGFTMPAAGGSPVAAVGFPDGIQALTVSAAGDTVAWSLPTSGTTASIQSASLASHAASSVVTVVSTGLNREPAFARDGSTLYFSHDNGTNADVWVGTAGSANSGEHPGAPVTGGQQLDVALVATDDGTAPGAATFLPFILNGASATLRWSLPADADLSGVEVTRGDTTVFVPAPLTQYTDAGLKLGYDYTYTVRAVDRSGNLGPESSRSLNAMRPQPSFADPTSTWSTKASFPVRLGPVGQFDAAYTVDVQPVGSTVWSRWITARTGEVRTFGTAASSGINATSSAPGASYTFRVKVRDPYGNESAFVTSTHAVVPFDQAKAYLSGGTTVTSSAAYLGSYRRMSKSSEYARVTLTGNRLQVVGWKCASCGVFYLYDGSTKVASVSTYSATTFTRTVLYSRSYPSVATHTFTLRPAATSGHPYVLLDGWAMRR